MYYISIRSGLGIGRYSKSNDLDSVAKKPDRHPQMIICVYSAPAPFNQVTYHLVMYHLLRSLDMEQYLTIPNLYPLRIKKLKGIESESGIQR